MHCSRSNVRSCSRSGTPLQLPRHPPSPRSEPQLPARRRSPVSSKHYCCVRTRHCRYPCPETRPVVSTSDESCMQSAPARPRVPYNESTQRVMRTLKQEDALSFSAATSAVAWRAPGHVRCQPRPPHHAPTGYAVRRQASAFGSPCSAHRAGTAHAGQARAPGPTRPCAAVHSSPRGKQLCGQRHKDWVDSSRCNLD